MKKIVLTLIISLVTFFAIAQETKPTKEQTINFLKQKFTDKKFNHQWKYQKTSTYWDAISFSYNCTQIKFDGCILILEYSEQRIEESNYETTKKDQPKNTILSIDFSKVESVFFSASSGYKSSNTTSEYLISLVFNQQTTEGKLIEVILPFISLDESSYKGFDSKEDQIYKAFNYLRKLCGAPEPPKPLKFE